MWKSNECKDPTMTRVICAHITTLKKKLEEEYERQGCTEISLWYETYVKSQKKNMKVKDMNLCVKTP